MATEAIVRHRLREVVLAAAGEPSEARYEFWVPQSNERADVVVVGAAMAGYEIKTERDTLKRLPRQAAAYGRLFDRCTAVLAERHLTSAMEILPDWWGVIAIVTDEEPPTFRSVRLPTPNDGVDPETLVRLLWRDEVHAALCGLGAVPAPRTGRFRMWEQLLVLLDLESLKAVVRETLLRREPVRPWVPSPRLAVTT